MKRRTFVKHTVAAMAAGAIPEAFRIDRFKTRPPSFPTRMVELPGAVCYIIRKAAMEVK